ncbi:Urate_ox_N domain-containing protein [Vibrio chagasii]|uniref:urate hydroxylase PuuD n=1 Tax=Vibrio sp. 99K-1 TaxID=2607603 RepID=UPI0014935806|nr:urate hydroxylase PuuD [Vibrio sp. 99K-1]CAH6896135.1 Urate_ox_N domain-containing protein [Vibrio chagasii]NOI84248.1 urate hydroxylase PuuD [Vibrio sp. 99K-1]CAH6937262.1 Urate_ox_N domain-containing protein [Vibrio chagasii]CAH7105835.1 Urate_ox_N domain-containing protein [Vibrio chagasii]CAH7268649.1 Urate_ox_N domain-containing protein [Vibrio chagasii]
MDPHITEWLNLAIRWIHMIVGVAWIGASFYFVWLENNLNRVNPKTGLSGDLWAIHGGGIYHLEKYKLAPPEMPEHLHWFKWEAYFTWITGVCLLGVVYYLNAEIYLIAPGSGLDSTTAIAIGIGSFVAGWFIYDLLCDSPLGKTPVLLGVVLFVLLVAATYGLTQVFSGRGAYIHVGAIIGTIMVGNVFRVIMPAQRNLVKAIEEKREPDPALPAKGLLRSRHNNYMTLPVLFIMISNHFPSTYGSEYNWLILAGLAIFSILVRHYFNTRHGSQKFAWTVPVAALGMITLAFVTSPYAKKQMTPVVQAPVVQEVQVSTTESSPEELAVNSTPSATTDDQQAPAHATQPASAGVRFETINKVIQERCSVCHSATPSHAAFAAAPAGVMLDTPEEIKANVPRIVAQTVTTQVMPLGNMTQMTDEERALIGTWVEQGATIQ